MFEADSGSRTSKDPRVLVRMHEVRSTEAPGRVLVLVQNKHVVKTP